MLGSGVVAGTRDLEHAYSRTDRAGFTLGEDLERIGYRGTMPARRRGRVAAGGSRGGERQHHLMRAAVITGAAQGVRPATAALPGPLGWRPVRRREPGESAAPHEIMTHCPCCGTLLLVIVARTGGCGRQ